MSIARLDRRASRFLILIHEAGHFFTARAVGMKPRRFYIGFPPAVLKTTRNGIEYGVGAIPFGRLREDPRECTGRRRPTWTCISGLRCTSRRACSRRSSGSSEASPRATSTGARAALQELERAIEQAPLSSNAKRSAARGLDDLADALGSDAYWRQRTWKRLVVIAAGPGANLLFAIALLAAVYMIGIPSDASRRVGDVIPESPAATAGLQPGDVIVGLNRVPTYDFRDVRDAIRSSGGKPLVISVVRNGRYVELPPARPQKHATASTRSASTPRR